MLVNRHGTATFLTTSVAQPREVIMQQLVVVPATRRDPRPEIASGRSVLTGRSRATHRLTMTLPGEPWSTTWGKRDRLARRAAEDAAVLVEEGQALVRELHLSLRMTLDDDHTTGKDSL